MREESHLDDMRAAIRGDFERLARRRGNQELMQEPSPAPEEEPSEPEAVHVETEVDPEPETAAELPRKSFLARLLGR